jgi:hypothetical protein
MRCSEPWRQVTAVCSPGTVAIHSPCSRAGRTTVRTGFPCGPRRRVNVMAGSSLLVVACPTASAHQRRVPSARCARPRHAPSTDSIGKLVLVISPTRSPVSSLISMTARPFRCNRCRTRHPEMRSVLASPLASSSNSACSLAGMLGDIAQTVISRLRSGLVPVLASGVEAFPFLDGAFAAVIAFGCARCPG